MALHRTAVCASDLRLGVLDFSWVRARRSVSLVVRPTPHMVKLIVTLPVVFGAQGVMAWLFYRSRAVSHASWTDSDFVVFGLPLVLGFAVSVCVLFFRFPPMSASRRMTT